MTIDADGQSETRATEYDSPNQYKPEIWEERYTPNQDAEEPNSYEERGSYDRDRGRIIHTPAFRRLQAKTQVLDITEGDYHRTRLTHTMEVAQIGRGIVLHLLSVWKDDPRKVILPDYDLIEAIAFAHDLGHPPFGHNGEVALNYMMREHGGFEGNGQSLRLLTHSEKRWAKNEERQGLSLTRRTLLGVLKYPQPYMAARRFTLPSASPNYRLVNQSTWKPPKCYYDSQDQIVKWIVDPVSNEDRIFFRSWKDEPTETTHGKTAHKSLDCSVLELADDIAYATHDLEDGIALGFINIRDWNAAFDPHATDTQERRLEVLSAKIAWNEWSGDPTRHTPDLDGIRTLLFGSGPQRRKAVSHLLGGFIHSIAIDELPAFTSPLLGLRAQLPKGLAALLKILGRLTYEKVIQSAEVQTLEFRGRIMIMELFEAIVSDPSLILKDRQRHEYKTAMTEAVQMRVICDFVAGMTDPYATRFYERLFVPRSGSAFDKL